MKSFSVKHVVLLLGFVVISAGIFSFSPTQTKAEHLSVVVCSSDHIVDLNNMNIIAEQSGIKVNKADSVVSVSRGTIWLMLVPDRFYNRKLYTHAFKRTLIRGKPVNQKLFYTLKAPNIDKRHIINRLFKTEQMHC